MHFDLCRSRCCPEVVVDRRPRARFPVTLVERGGLGGRKAATLRLTRAEATELARVLAEQGLAPLDFAHGKAPGA